MIELKHKDYFEGVLQLRNYTKEIINFVRTSTQKDNRALITEEKKVGSKGLDLKFTSQKYLQILGKKLKKKFPGVLKISAKLHTRKKDKNLYRITVLFIHTPLKKNQIIKVKDENFKVINWNKKVLIKNVKTGKKLNLRFEELPKNFF